MDDLTNRYFRKQFWAILIGGVMLVTVWAILGRFVPEGWGLGAVNVIGFLLSIMFIGMGSQRALRWLMPSFLAWVLAFCVWAIMVFLVRSLILSALGA